jgi:hypothetical protein
VRAPKFAFGFLLLAGKLGANAEGRAKGAKAAKVFHKLAFVFFFRHLRALRATFLISV